jgi:phytoene desaturase
VQKKFKVAVVGSGVAGLATAIRLACKGHAVTVFEANAYPGGKLSAFSLPSEKENSAVYRFDAGPSLFTMPQYVEALFEEAKVPISDYFQYKKLDTVCHYFWQDGTRLTAWADLEKFSQEAENQLNIEKGSMQKALVRAARKYHSAGRIFLEKSLHKPRTWLSWEVLKSLVLMPTFDIFKTMNATHESMMKGNPKAVQFFNRFATYNGSDPYRASGMLSVIPHFEHGIGTFYPVGGMHTITEALYKLAKHLGVAFHFNQKVTRIEVENSRAVGILTEKHTTVEPFDRVVSNADVYFTYKKLMPTQAAPEKTLRQERSTSALIFYWGINRRFSELDLHNIFFSDNYASEFAHLSAGKVTDDPTVYINITSKCTPTDAPEGCENWFVMINVPHNSGQEDWESLVSSTRLRVIEKLSKALGVQLAECIVAEEVLTPADIESKTQSYGGALYGTSSNSMLSAFLRHPNFSSKIEHLYFCGGSVHPGGGIPLALLSAKILADNFK